MEHTMKRLLVLSTILLLAAAPLTFAVETTGTILGAVHDSTGAAISNAKLTPVGKYTVRVEATGFAPYVQHGVTVNVNENARVDAQMRPGAVEQAVEVVADASQVDTTVATLGKVVDER